MLISSDIMNRFELHCHSCYSKGKKIPWEGIPSPKETIRHAKNAGLSGIAITDHNSSGGWKEAAAEAKRLGIVFIPGIEIDSASGHIIGLGVNEKVERDLSADETIEKIRQQGGIAIAPHPFDGEGYGIRHEFTKTDAVEVFNSFDVDRIGNFITARKAGKLGLRVVVGSDAHTLEMIGNSVIKADADDMDSVLKNIKNGSVMLEKRYIETWKIIRWLQERMGRSRNDLMGYIEKNYSGPKAAVSKFLVREFLKNPESVSWRCLAALGINIYFMKSIITPSTYL
jgi:predicted metal-dependent phosphoesterase TrpH